MQGGNCEDLDKVKTRVGSNGLVWYDKTVSKGIATELLE
jgi:hypothetical protein